ncbi:hypothetical protein [Faecalibacterium prausnitzii]
MDYYRGLLALRAAFPRLGSTDRHAPEALQFFALEQPLVGWMLRRLGRRRSMERFVRLL